VNPTRETIVFLILSVVIRASLEVVDSGWGRARM